MSITFVEYYIRNWQERGKGEPKIPTSQPRVGRPARMRAAKGGEEGFHGKRAGSRVSWSLKAE
jgi:hypothetical protein